MPLKLSGGRDSKLQDAVQTGFFSAFDGGERNMQNLVDAAVRGAKGGNAAAISLSLKNGLLRGLERLPSFQSGSDGYSEQLEQQRIALLKQDALQVKLGKLTGFILTLAALGVLALVILEPALYENAVGAISQLGIVDTVRESVPLLWAGGVVLSFLVFKLLRRFNKKFFWRLFLGIALFLLLSDLFYPAAAFSVRLLFSGITGIFNGLER
jgi:hypothetical protein